MEDMHYVYLLKSEEKSTFYVGYTHDLERRMSEHALGNVYYTRRYKPWKLIYLESYIDEERAKLRERKLKQYGSAYQGLLKRLGEK